jgi:hypothetical protein
MVAVAGHASSLDQPLLTQVTKVARAEVRAAAVVVSEVTTGDHSEGSDGGQVARLGATQGVDAVAVSNTLALGTAREIDMSRELVVSFAGTLRSLAIPLRPSRVLTIARVLVAALTVVLASTAAERSRIVIVAVTRTTAVDGLVVISLAVVEACAAARRVSGRVVVIARRRGRQILAASSFVPSLRACPRDSPSARFGASREAFGVSTMASMKPRRDPCTAFCRGPLAAQQFTYSRGSTGSLSRARTPKTHS